MTRKPRKNPMNASFPFDKAVDTGPMDYQSMDPSMAQTIHGERIRRQVQSRIGTKPRKRKFYSVVE